MHHLPLGGMMGERVAKSMTMYNFDQHLQGRNNFATMPTETDALVKDTNNLKLAKQRISQALRNEKNAKYTIDMVPILDEDLVNNQIVDIRRTSVDALP